ncbi:hypothetical protein EW145_g5416 [Phellinidium pouzarii]|uniref:Uncharacterized protein n=1 Tax=Phellinidium pouzarii TaxID=167371 RepID=A0A4S4L017_9AGAM|nr:hypothetical protein EW145_g5416 [Phellinidium pouzarii]
MITFPTFREQFFAMGAFFILQSIQMDAMAWPNAESDLLLNRSCKALVTLTENKMCTVLQKLNKAVSAPSGVLSSSLLTKAMVEMLGHLTDPDISFIVVRQLMRLFEDIYPLFLRSGNNGIVSKLAELVTICPDLVEWTVFEKFIFVQLESVFYDSSFDLSDKYKMLRFGDSRHWALLLEFFFRNPDNFPQIISLADRSVQVIDDIGFLGLHRFPVFLWRAVEAMVGFRALEDVTFSIEDVQKWYPHPSLNRIWNVLLYRPNILMRQILCARLAKGFVPTEIDMYDSFVPCEHLYCKACDISPSLGSENVERSESPRGYDVSHIFCTTADVLWLEITPGSVFRAEQHCPILAGTKKSGRKEFIARVRCLSEDNTKVLPYTEYICTVEGGATFAQYWDDEVLGPLFRSCPTGRLYISTLLRCLNALTRRLSLACFSRTAHDAATADRYKAIRMFFRQQINHTDHTAFLESRISNNRPTQQASIRVNVSRSAAFMSVRQPHVQTRLFHVSCRLYDAKQTSRADSSEESKLEGSNKNEGQEKTGRRDDEPTKYQHLENYSRFFRRLAMSLPPMQRPTRDDLLKVATNFWQRLRIRFKWFTIKSFRKFNADDMSAFFTWFLMSQTVWILVGTTTFFSAVFATANSLSLQENVARAISSYLTSETGVTIIFESAIVPKWKDSRIAFKNVYVSRRPPSLNDVSYTVDPNAAHRAAARYDVGNHPAYHGLDDDNPLPSPPTEDVNYAVFDLSVDSIDVTLSLWRWLDGKGLVKDAVIKGVRGVLDRRFIRYDPDKPLDPADFRHPSRPGDFQLESLQLEDLLISVYEPEAFRPYTFSIFRADLRAFRKQWMFYDFLAAENVVGQFDNCLFSLHKPQSIGRTTEQDLKDSRWSRMARFRIDGVNIDHLQRGTSTEGPISWITSGKFDAVFDIRFPHNSDEHDINAFLGEIAEAITTAASTQAARLVDRIPGQRELAKPPIFAPEDPAEIVASHADAPRVMSIDIDLRFRDLKATVPIFTRDLSYVNNALIRPIVAFINANKTLVPIHCRVVKDLGEFDGAWTMWETGLMNEIALKVYDALAYHVTQANFNRRVRTVSLWSLQKTLAAALSALQATMQPMIVHLRELEKSEPLVDWFPDTPYTTCDDANVAFLFFLLGSSTRRINCTTASRRLPCEFEIIMLSKTSFSRTNVHMLRRATARRSGMRFQSTVTHSSSSSSSYASHLAAGVAGGATVALVGYVWYHTSGLKTAMQISKDIKTYLQSTRDSVVAKARQTAQNPSQALSYLRDVAKSYAAAIPGAAGYVDKTFDELDALHEQHGDEMDSILSDITDELQRAASEGGADAKTALKVYEVLSKSVRRMQELGKKVGSDFLEKNPAIKETFGSGYEQLRNLAEKAGPEGKKALDEVTKQIKDIISKGKPDEESLEKARKLLKDKTAQIRKIVESSSGAVLDNGSEKLNAFLNSIPGGELKEKAPHLKDIMNMANERSEDAKRLTKETFQDVLDILEEKGRKAKELAERTKEDAEKKSKS